jgi:Fe-S-cluster-containing hydrogenase component 2
VYKDTGYLEIIELGDKLPSPERFEKGPVAVIECIQEIPCNPCQEACNRNAILAFKHINDTPRVESELCNGCGLCVSVCPGLAIFIVWKNYSDTEALIKIPFEMLPLPVEGKSYDLLNRKGEVIGKGKVTKVQTVKSNPKSRVIWIAIPKALYMDARNIRTGE